MPIIGDASIEDAEAILALQRLAYQSEAEYYDDWTLPPLTQTIESLRDEFKTSVILKATIENRIVGSVRAAEKDKVCAIGRLVVHPDFQRHGIGSKLLQEIEQKFPDASSFELFTGSKREATIRLYQRHGYKITQTLPLLPKVSFTFLAKAGKGRGGSEG